MSQISDRENVGVYQFGLSIDVDKDEEISYFEPWEGIEMEIPKSISLEPFVPKVRSQGDAENSGGWAVGYYFASTEWAMISNQSNKAVATAFAYDPLYLNKAASIDGDGCSGEVYLSDLCQNLIDNGAKRLNIDPSDCNPTASLDKSHSLLDFQEMMRLTSHNGPDSNNILSVKYALANYHAVVFSMNVPESFEYVARDGMFRPSQAERDRATPTQAHALTIVGFDDDLFGGAFRVVNSWGTEWGDEGYCWISYDDFNRFQQAAYMIYTELKVPDLVAYGVEENGFGRKHIKKHGFFEGILDEKGRPDKGIYMNEALKKGRGGSRFMKRLVKKHGGFLIYTEDNFDIPIAAVIY
ncbi:MAG: hypothetical protein Crog3KO_00950 [Crocinitomicaceae bacterium]